MPQNKLAMPRIMRLISMMKENRFPNHARLVAEMKKLDPAGTYQISQKTVQRDILYLKNEFKAPIRYDNEKRGYFLTNPEWTLDVPLLEETDMKAAVLGARLAETLFPSPVRGEVRQAVDHLLSGNEKGLDENASLLALVATGARVPIQPEIFSEIFKAWQTHHAAEIHYKGASSETPEPMLLEPHVLVFHDGIWYLKAKLLERSGRVLAETPVRTLALHRISDARLHPGNFQPDSALIRESNAGDIFHLPKVRNIRMRLTGSAVTYARENFSGEFKAFPDGSAELLIPSADEYKLLQFIFTSGGEARAIAPDEFKKKVRSIAEKVLNAHF